MNRFIHTATYRLGIASFVLAITPAVVQAQRVQDVQEWNNTQWGMTYLEVRSPMPFASPNSFRGLTAFQTAFSTQELQEGHEEYCLGVSEKPVSHDSYESSVLTSQVWQKFSWANGWCFDFKREIKTWHYGNEDRVENSQRMMVSTITSEGYSLRVSSHASWSSSTSNAFRILIAEITDYRARGRATQDIYLGEITPYASGVNPSIGTPEALYPYQREVMEAIELLNQYQLPLSEMPF